MQLVVDEVIVAQDTNFLIALGLGFILLHVISALTQGVRSWVVLYVGTQLSFQLVSNLFRHLLRLPLEFFERRHVGDIVSRFDSIDQVQRMLTTGFVEGFVDGVMVVLTLIMMYVYSPVLAAIATATVLLYLVIRLALYRPLWDRTEEMILQGAKEDSVFLETVRAMQTLKAFGKETQRQSLWQNQYAEAVNANTRVEKIRIWFTTLHQLVVGAEYVALVWIGATIIIDSNLTVGMLYAFLSWRKSFSDQARALVDRFLEYRMLRLHLGRIADIVHSPPEANLHSERGELKELKGEIELRDVHFQYSPGEPEILSGVSLKIHPGECVALSGRSGCGKTTLLKLMMGLLQPTKGQVLVDGIELGQLGLAEYRRHIASVMQDDKLLSGSISDNISFNDPKVDQQRVEACAVAAQMGEDILQMPMGFQSLVGDLGTTLSGGQQQRVLLARALYAQPKILFLDEATAHLDTEAERKVNVIVKKLGITRIMVAHRQETLKLADRVIDLRPTGAETVAA
jgi:ATP-binding cassette subfamily B protein RaxB